MLRAIETLDYAIGAATQAQESVTLQAQEPATILIVDDDPISRLITRHTLMHTDYRLLEAANGEEALKLYREYAPDLLLLDALMPGMDGFEVCAQLRAQNYSTPVLMITRLEDEASVERAFEAGADDFITKPIHKAVLRHRIASIIQAYQLQQHITHLAYHDPLTNLPNRQLLIDRLTTALTQAKRSQRKLALLFIDLDNFKTVNDTLGHAQGDALLRMIAQRLIACVRESDTIARLGGDEFIILLNDIQAAEDVSRVADKLLQAISEPVCLQEHELQISGSIGIALYPGDGADAGTLLKNADIAMYQAKELGRYRFRFYASEMSQYALHRMLLVSSLHKALEEQQLFLHYQSRFNLATGRLTAVEALLRWHHPELGILLPGEFIPLAQDLSLLPRISMWALQQICMQGVAWNAERQSALRMVCNLTSQELIHPEFLTGLARVLQDTGFDSHHLEIELGNEIDPKHEPQTRQVMQQLKSQGIEFIMNDFSDGRIPLRSLAHLPLNGLKINRLFLQGTPANSTNATLTRAIAGISHNLQLNLLADGIETEAQHRFLREIGCSEAQGYLFAKPCLAAQLDLKQQIAVFD
ncbi:MAG: EAL domain-containing protein [Gammaproteobacteria bacterium]